MIKLFDQFINEMLNNSDKITSEIEKFYEAQNRIAELKEEIKEIEKNFSEFEKELNPILDKMKILEDRTLETNKYIVSIKKFGGEAINPKYKEAFELALTKVNKATRNILELCLNETKKVSKVSHSYNVIKKQDISESFSDVKNTIKSFVFNLLKYFTDFIKNIDQANNELKKIINNI